MNILSTTSIYIIYNLTFVAPQSSTTYSGPMLSTVFLTEKAKGEYDNFRVFIVIFRSKENKPPVSFEKDKECDNIYRLELNESVEISVSTLESELYDIGDIHKKSIPELIRILRQQTNRLVVTHHIDIQLPVRLYDLHNMNQLSYLSKSIENIPQMENCVDSVFTCTKPIFITDNNKICHDMSFSLYGANITTNYGQQLNPLNNSVLFSNTGFGVQDIEIKERYSCNKLEFKKRCDYTINVIEDLYASISENFKTVKVKQQDEYPEFLMFFRDEEFFNSAQNRLILIKDKEE